MFLLSQNWTEILGGEFEKPYFLELRNFLDREFKKNVIFPEKKKVFNALNLTPFEQIKVVILGQDPYHGEGQANGMCFSVNKNVGLPPSLKNIFKELHDDLGICNQTGDLTPWARQGVLLLNSTLTVRKSCPTSHAKKGWEELTDFIIKTVSQNLEYVVFILWGSYAIKKGEVIDTKKHHIISSSHPSFYSASRGFFGSRPFSKTNSYLKKQGIQMIDWSNG